MAKKHMRIYVEAKDYATIQNISKWLDQNLDKTKLSSNVGWQGDGEVMIKDKCQEIENKTEKEIPAHLSLFMNVTKEFNRTRLMELIKGKTNKIDVSSKIIYIKIEAWICTHDEKFPQPCIPKIIYEKGVKG